MMLAIIRFTSDLIAIIVSSTMLLTCSFLGKWMPIQCIPMASNTDLPLCYCSCCINKCIKKVTLCCEKNNEIMNESSYPCLKYQVVVIDLGHPN